MEGLKDLDKINTDQHGDVVELRDYKLFQPSNKKKMGNKENIMEEEEPKQHKEEIILCQPLSKGNMNAHLTTELEKLLKVYTVLKDEGRQ